MSYNTFFWQAGSIVQTYAETTMREEKPVPPSIDADIGGLVKSSVVPSLWTPPVFEVDSLSHIWARQSFFFKRGKSLLVLPTAKASCGVGCLAVQGIGCGCFIVSCRGQEVEKLWRQQIDAPGSSVL